MSVRRLADSNVQPAAFAFNAAMSSAADTWIKKYPEGRQQSAVIPLLMLAQEQDGWVTKAAIEQVANMLSMPYIRVLEVATFYTQFQLKPVGTKAHVQVCGTTPCMLRGSEALMDVCRSKIHHDQFHLNESGTLSWEEVECLGACVNAPMVMVFKDTFEDLTPERLAEIIDQFEAGNGAGVPVGPQVDRKTSSAQGGLTALTDENAVLKSTRDREAAAASAAAGGEAAPAADAAPLMTPPSNAAKPKTDAPETNAALKSPSAEKVSAAAESVVSVKAPSVSADANKTSAVVEEQEKPRQGKGTAALEVSATPAQKAPAVKAAKPSLDDERRPAGIERPATPDDLQLISGVGPKIEATLHSLGIFRFAQIAGWRKTERDWVDGYLSFHGRIDREEWVKQAEALAKGGVAEYIRVFNKEPR